MRYDFAVFYSNLGINDRVIFLDETGFNLYVRPTKGRARIGQPVRRNTVPRGRNITATFTISADVGLVCHRISHNTTTGATFQTFVNELCQQIENIYPPNENVYIIYDGARPHLHANPPAEFQGRIFCRIQPSYSPFLNPTELAHSAFKAAIKQKIGTRAIQDRLADEAARLHAGVTITEWRLRILTTIAENSLNTITLQKCQNWFARILRYIPRCLNRQEIV